MINAFDDFCLWMYFVVDDIWLKIAPFFKLPGPKPDCSDSELLVMAPIGECRGWDIEANHAHTFWDLCARLYTKLTAYTLCIYTTICSESPTSYKSNRWLSLSSIRLN